MLFSIYVVHIIKVEIWIHFCLNVEWPQESCLLACIWSALPVRQRVQGGDQMLQKCIENWSRQHWNITGPVTFTGWYKQCILFFIATSSLYMQMISLIQYVIKIGRSQVHSSVIYVWHGSYLMVSELVKICSNCSVLVITNVTKSSNMIHQ